MDRFWRGEAMKRASSPRTSRRFTGELSCWAQGQRRFFPYWSKTLGLAGYLKVQLMWGQVHLLWCLAYSYWVDFGSSIYIKNETRLLWLRCFCFRTLRTFQTFGYEVSSANRRDLLQDKRYLWWQYLQSSFMIYTAALFSEEACEEWIGYYGWPICGVWHWPQRWLKKYLLCSNMLAWHSKDTFFRETHVGMLTQHEVFLQAGVQVWVFNKA